MLQPCYDARLHHARLVAPIVIFLGAQWLPSFLGCSSTVMGPHTLRRRSWSHCFEIGWQVHLC